MSSQQAFSEAVTTITARIADKAINSDLQSFLDENFPPGGEAFDDLAELCRQGIDEGWLCANPIAGNLEEAIRGKDRATEQDLDGIDRVFRVGRAGAVGFRLGYRRL